MKDDQKKVAVQTRASLFKSFAIISAVSGYIFGPMIFFGGIGIWLGRRFDSAWYPILFLILALVISNIFIFKRSSNLLTKLKLK